MHTVAILVYDHINPSVAMLRIHFQRFVQTSPQAYRHSFNLKRATRTLQPTP
jgi:hypothetical protein